MSGKVIHLIERAHGIAPDGQQGLGEWLVDWAGQIAAGKQGDINNIAIVFERADGSLGKVCQSLTYIDTNTFVGLLQRVGMAAHLGELTLYEDK